MCIFTNSKDRKDVPKCAIVEILVNFNCCFAMMLHLCTADRI